MRGRVPWEAGTCRRPGRPGRPRCPTLAVPLSFPVLRLGDELQIRRLRQPPRHKPAGCSGQALKGGRGPPHGALGRGRVGSEGCEGPSRGPQSPRPGRAALEVGLGWGRSLRETAGPPRGGRVSTFPTRGTEAQGGRRHRRVHAASVRLEVHAADALPRGRFTGRACNGPVLAVPSQLCSPRPHPPRHWGEPSTSDRYPKSQAGKRRSQPGGTAASPPHSPGSEPSPGGGSRAGP